MAMTAMDIIGCPGFPAASVVEGAAYPPGYGDQAELCDDGYARHCSEY
ncbi:MAG: hypothetical protein JRF56_15980 [Deltaproteobacteria bacterium]|nr:hypothetical protein [Deltaproteobacteria bacterium]